MKPNLVTYNIAIGGLCRAERVEEAKAVLEEMKERGLAPDGYTFSILCDGYLRLGRFRCLGWIF